MRTIGNNQNGVSIIAAIFIIVILAFMGVMFLSMVNTASLTSVNNMQSVQALYLAEGGLQFALMNGTYCTYSAASTALGSGTFSIWSQNTGSATLTTSLTATATSFGAAPSAADYSDHASVQIDSEYIYCTGISGGNLFTGCTRSWAGSSAAVHTAGAAITQCIVTSTGSVGGATRTIQATVGQ